MALRRCSEMSFEMVFPCLKTPYVPYKIFPPRKPYVIFYDPFDPLFRLLRKYLQEVSNDHSDALDLVCRVLVHHL